MPLLLTKQPFSWGWAGRRKTTDQQINQSLGGSECELGEARGFVLFTAASVPRTAPGTYAQ